MKTVKITLVLFVVLLISILIFLLNSSFSKYVAPSNDESSIELKNGWEYKWEGSNVSKSLSFPGIINGGAPGKILYISNTLPKENFNDATLFIRTSQQYLKVYLDGHLIYSNDSDTNVGYSKLPGSVWHFVRLPQDYQGSKVQILLSSPYKQYSGHVNSIYIGSKSSHILSILHRYGSTLIISSIIFLLGIIFVFLFCILISEIGKFESVLSLGIFSLLMGVWIASESKIIQLFINNPILIFHLACISLFLSPIPLLLFIVTTYKLKGSKWLIGFVWVFTAFFIIVSIMQIFNNAAYLQYIIIFHLLLLFCILTVIHISIREILSGNKSIKLFFFGCIILCTFSLIDLYGFYFGTLPGLNAQGFMQFGILLFILMMSASLGHLILDIYDIKAKNDMYAALAYTDILTGLKNRTSYEEMILKLNENLETEDCISIIIFDLNNLKNVNDSLGHKEGDRLICSESRLINDSFGNIGEVYRIGGDEIVTIIRKHSESEINNSLSAFNNKIDEYNACEENVKIGISYGMSSFKRDEDEDLHSVFMRADEAMYECKQRQKQAY